VVEIYENLLEVPLDEVDEPDGDDSIVPGVEGAEFSPPLPIIVTLLARVGPRRIVAPFIVVKRGDHGPAVFAVKRAALEALNDDQGWKSLAAATPVSKRFAGPFFPKLMGRLQKHFHITQTGRYDRATHLKLAPFYDRRGLALLAEAKKPVKTKEQKLREAFLVELTYLYNRRWNIIYSQHRPFDTDRNPWGLDCSSSGEWVGKWSGIGSLSGFPSAGYGNTDSQLARFRRLGRLRSTSAAENGDPLYYGRGGDPSHVAYWIGGERVWSFGSYPAKILHYRYRHDLITCCDLLGSNP
jgi:hypothetical protein